MSRPRILALAGGGDVIVRIGHEKAQHSQTILSLLPILCLFAASSFLVLNSYAATVTLHPSRDVGYYFIFLGRRGKSFKSYPSRMATEPMMTIMNWRSARRRKPKFGP